jgi:hypothetical protein
MQEAEASIKPHPASSVDTTHFLLDGQNRRRVKLERQFCIENLLGYISMQVEWSHPEHGLLAFAGFALFSAPSALFTNE